MINTIRHRVNGQEIFDGYIADISCLLTGGEQGASPILGSRLRAGAAISPFGSGRTVIPHFYDQSDLVGLKNTSFPSSRTGSLSDNVICRTLLCLGLRSFVNMIFSIYLHHSGLAWFFPRVLDTLQLAMSEVGSCGKTCLDGTNILDWDSKAAPLHMP